MRVHKCKLARASIQLRAAKVWVSNAALQKISKKTSAQHITQSCDHALLPSTSLRPGKLSKQTCARPTTQSCHYALLPTLNLLTENFDENLCEAFHAEPRPCVCFTQKNLPAHLRGLRRTGQKRNLTCMSRLRHARYPQRVDFRDAPTEPPPP